MFVCNIVTQDGWLAVLISAWMAVVAILLCKELVNK